jgi:hypothetical protein
MSIDSLYLGRADNGSGHEVYKLSTKQLVFVNRITSIPTTDNMIDTVNNIAKQESQPEGIEFSDMHGRITLEDFIANDNDEDSNASDNDFKLDEEYKASSEQICAQNSPNITGTDRRYCPRTDCIPYGASL